jgi:hypothetical protein
VRRIDLAAGRFEDLGRPDGIGEDHLFAVAIESLVMRPDARQRPVPPAVAPEEAAIGKALIVRIRPSGTVRIGDVDPADDPRMDLVAAVEVDVVPVMKP